MYTSRAGFQVGPGPFAFPEGGFAEGGLRKNED